MLDVRNNLYGLETQYVCTKVSVRGNSAVTTSSLLIDITPPRRGARCSNFRSDIVCGVVPGPQHAPISAGTLR